MKTKGRRLRAPEWLQLDNAGKIYPATRSQDWMAIYRLSVTLEEPVDRVLLGRALQSTLKRLPYFGYRLRRGLFWFYLEQQDAVPTIQDDAANPCMPLSRGRDGHFMFRVRVHEARIAVEIFHVLADATGTMTFLLTLTAEYLRLKHGHRVPPTPLVLDLRDKPDPAEWEDSFPKYARQAARPRSEEAAYPLRGTPAERDYLQVVTGMTDTAALAQKAKAHGVSVNTYLAAHIYINMPIYQRYGAYSFDDILNQVKHYMGYETGEQLINARFSGNVHAEQSRLLRLAPLFLKTLVLRLMYALTGERYFTSVMSNLGLITLPDVMARRVTRMDFIIGGGRSNPVSIGCVSVNGRTFINFSKTIREATLEQRVLTAMVRDGLHVTVESNRRMTG